MLKSITKYSQIIIFGIPLLLILFLVVLVKSQTFKSHPNQLSLAVIFDFIVSIPLIYFLLIRQKNIEKWTVFSLMIIGAAIATYLIPAENQYYLSLFKKWILPIVEISVISLLIHKLRTTFVDFRTSTNHQLDFYSALKETSKSILPAIPAVLFSTEIAVIYYGFFCWKKPKLSDNQYTYHIKNGSLALFYAFVVLILIESSVVHLLVAKYSVTAAWVLSILSIYGAIQFWGFAKAITQRPIQISDKNILLRYGIFCETDIEMNQIQEIKTIKYFDSEEKSIQQFSPLKNFESPNTIIILKAESTIVGLYGKQKMYKKLALFIDENEKFKGHIKKIINDFEVL
jgi:hypothetical protein